ncbi:MAG: L-2-hydroxyglutarate oxidase [Planctomycetia bacterium]|nr:L-2-hydroxyglutarate oxidase [Planctomycetia bacterium]
MIPGKGDRSVVVVGGGLVGLATAWRLLQQGQSGNVTVLEKDARVACQQSTHNSGVLHAGLFYKPGSEKALLSVRGLRQMVEFCQEHRIAHDICGKLVVATNDRERAQLDVLWERGTANGLQGLRRLSSPEKIREIEPHAAGVAAIHVPEEGIVDYRAVADALAAEVTRLGGRIVLNARVNALARDANGWLIATTAGDFPAAFVITCGGLHSDRLVELSGLRPSVRIVPFRGEYFHLRREAEVLVRNLVYPVPDPSFPFLGVHFTRMIHGGVEAGPNAVLAWAREGYARRSVNLRDALGSLTFQGLWRFLARHPRMCGYEVWRSWSRREFCRSLQKLVPAVQLSDLVPGGAGVRAQAMRPDGRLVEDFEFVRGERILHVVNAPSPAATASLAIGERIAGIVIGGS